MSGSKIKALFNHILWSSQPVASRYLQVFAQPVLFDGQAVLCTAKAASAILLFAFSHAVCPDKKEQQQHEAREADRNEVLAPPNKRTKVFFALLFGSVATFRAALNIASSKFTLSFYTTTINSLTPIVVAFGDAYFLKANLPRALWPCVIASFVGCVVIGASQSPAVMPTGSFTSDDAVGCALQFLSMCFSAAARLLMKRTEHILTRNEAVQTNNACNFTFPFLYTIITNPGGWEAFRHIFVAQNLLAWLTIAVLVYTIGSTGQMSLVRSMGPGMYSSLSSVRVLGSVLLSTIWLNEPVRNWLEWLGLAIIMITMTIYTLASVDKTPNKAVRRVSGITGDDEEQADNASSRHGGIAMGTLSSLQQDSEEIIEPLTASSNPST